MRGIAERFPCDLVHVGFTAGLEQPGGGLEEVLARAELLVGQLSAALHEEGPSW